MTATNSGKKPIAIMSGRKEFVFWLLLIAGLFLNVTLHLSDSGRVLLLSVFDVLLVSLFALQFFRVGLQWHLRLA